MAAKTNNLVNVSDSHCACQLGLMSPLGLRLPQGNRIPPSPFQRWMWECWRDFWCRFVPLATEGEPFDVNINGDIVDNRHHGTTTLLTQNLAEMFVLAREAYYPILGRVMPRPPEKIGDKKTPTAKRMPLWKVSKQVRRVFVVGGTDAHAGIAGELEEMLGEMLGATPNEHGKFCRQDLWIALGTKGHHSALVHCAHTVGSTGVAAYESTAPHRELVEGLQEAARWHNRPADVEVRSHRHRHIMTQIQGANGLITSLVTGGWQGKTPYVSRSMSGRQSIPTIGASVVRSGDQDTYVRSAVYGFKRSPMA